MTTDQVIRHGVPMPMGDEAPSSWLSRLALAQGCSLEALLDFLGLEFRRDADLQLHGLALTELRLKCGLPTSAFLAADRAMTRLNKSWLGASVLCGHHTKTSCFHYCPLCMRERDPPSFPIHWRFLDWRYCPDHGCLMESSCWHCKRSLRYPLDMAATKAGSYGHGSQRRCQRCSADLGAATPIPADPSRPGVVSDIEAHWMLAGREIVKLVCRPISDKEIPSEVQRSIEMNWLPTAGQWEQVERRLRSSSGHSVVRGSKAQHGYSRLRPSWAGRTFQVVEPP
ncbi:TniQ family protein [Roseateles sp. P5_E1]